VTTARLIPTKAVRAAVHAYYGDYSGWTPEQWRAAMRNMRKALFTALDKMEEK
jgi:hypothetical protein